MLWWLYTVHIFTFYYLLTKWELPNCCANRVLSTRNWTYYSKPREQGVQEWGSDPKFLLKPRLLLRQLGP